MDVERLQRRQAGQLSRPFFSQIIEAEVERPQFRKRGQVLHSRTERRVIAFKRQVPQPLTSCEILQIFVTNVVGAEIEPLQIMQRSQLAKRRGLRLRGGSRL